VYDVKWVMVGRRLFGGVSYLDLDAMLNVQESDYRILSVTLYLRLNVVKNE
jgi:hypothetical protein